MLRRRAVRDEDENVDDGNDRESLEGTHVDLVRKAAIETRSIWMPTIGDPSIAMRTLLYLPRKQWLLDSAGYDPSPAWRDG